MFFKFYKEYRNTLIIDQDLLNRLFIFNIIDYYDYNDKDNRSFIFFLLDKYNLQELDKLYEELTPLLYSIKLNKYEITLYLIERGCNLFITDNKFNSPLNYFCIHDNPTERDFDLAYKLFDFLIYNIDIFAINIEGRIFLIYLIINHRSDLLSKWPFVNDKDVKRDYELISKLYKINNIVDIYFKCVSYYAIKYNYDNIANILLPTNPFNCLFENKTNLLMLSIMHKNNLTTIELINKSESNINDKDKFNKNALSYAIIYNNNEYIINLLLKNNIDVNIIDSSKNSILHYIVKEDNILLYNELKNKLNHSHKDNQNRLAIVYAIINNNETMVNNMLRYIDPVAMNERDVYELNIYDYLSLFNIPSQT